MTRLSRPATCLALACALGLAVIPAARANLLTNGGFETEASTPAIPPPGWTASGNGMAVDQLFAQSGSYDVAFTALATQPSPGILSQTVTTTSGQSYTLSFWLLDQNPFVGTETFNVSFGAFSTSYSGSGLTADSYANLVVTIPGSDVTSTSTTLSFTGVQDPYGLTPVFNLDNVSLTANSAAIPEPPAALLLLTGLGLAALVTARRRSHRA